MVKCQSVISIEMVDQYSMHFSKFRFLIACFFFFFSLKCLVSCFSLVSLRRDYVGSRSVWSGSAGAGMLLCV